MALVIENITTLGVMMIFDPPPCWPPPHTPEEAMATGSGKS